jgi:hypothetical protein
MGAEKCTVVVDGSGDKVRVNLKHLHCLEVARSEPTVPPTLKEYRVRATNFQAFLDEYTRINGVQLTGPSKEACKNEFNIAKQYYNLEIDDF